MSSDASFFHDHKKHHLTDGVRPICLLLTLPCVSQEHEQKAFKANWLKYAAVSVKDCDPQTLGHPIKVVAMSSLRVEIPKRNTERVTSPTFSAYDSPLSTPKVSEEAEVNKSSMERIKDDES